ncbi:hypothetical protein GCM10022393_35020 [Aquimarina addita]|uniref:DUF4398 domain-containing protein n=1 Tax=Aquimarina addita TaxID=870485 RepID=A0ABP6UUD9_9FLAO
MKSLTSVLLVSLFISQIQAQDVYEDALTAASYAYAHSKKAHEANNVFHTQEYADKAFEAFDKVEMLSDKCGCPEANEMAYEAKSNMESSLGEDTYERSRYYAKQARELGPKILEQLSDCRANNEDLASNEDMDSVDEDIVLAATEEVSRKQLELEEQRRQLEIEQEKLKQQIAEQEVAKAEFEAMRAAELIEQTAIKTKAEQALSKLENALQELGIAFNEETMFESQEEYSRSESDLKNETLEDTKSFYVNRAKELTEIAMEQLASYSENE